MPGDPTCLAALRQSGVLAALLTTGCLGFGDEAEPEAPALAPEEPWCGDGLIEAGREECDDGILNSDVVGTGCSTRCTARFCGDGLVLEGEECEDADSGGGTCLDCRRTCVVEVSLGEYTGFVIRTTGVLEAWGANGYGALGLGFLDNRKDPTAIPGRWSHVAAGSWFTLGIQADGTLRGWGRNCEGTLGDGAPGPCGPGSELSEAHHTPVRIGAATGWKAVAAGRMALAIDAAGKVHSWGPNTAGALGQGLPEDAIVAEPARVLLPEELELTAISARGYSALALASDGTVWSWGANDLGQAGSGQPAVALPARLPGLEGCTAIAAGGASSLAICGERELYAWGNNASGAVGTGDLTTAVYPAPVRIGAGQRWLAIAAERDRGHAIDESGTLHSWGATFEVGWAEAQWGGDSAGSLGLGETAEPVAAPAAVRSEVRFQAVAAGTFHTAALAADGAVYLFGSNTFYASGFGLDEPRSEPTLLATICPAL